MINRAINSLLRRRHFWRYATFSEVAELYATRLLRIFALHMISLFIAVYLYNQGYSLVFIFGYLACYYLLKVPISFIAGWLVAWRGPKHTILYANIAYIPALIAFSFVPEAGAPHALLVICIFAMFQAVSATLYDYAHLVNFSKVKNVQHAGKELSYMHTVEKIAGVVSPVIGGLIATTFGATTVMIIAAVLFAVAAMPLMRTGEPTKTRQKVRWSGFPWKMARKSIIAETGVGFDVVTSSVVWSLFLAAIVFVSQHDEVYAIIGVLSGIGMIVALVSALIFGKIIDRKAGQLLLRYGVIGKSLTHILRPIVGDGIGAAATNAGAEVSTTAYSMSFTRGMFDVADYSGFRFTYLLLIEMAVNVGASLACFVAMVLMSIVEEKYAFILFFAVASMYVLIIATPRFSLYKR